MSSPLAPVLEFLNKLSLNNNRPWFEAHRADYERAKGSIEAFFFDRFPALGLDRGSHKASFYFHRIYRDVRFSKGKPPYKTSLSAVFDPAGKKTPGLGAYFHLEPGHESVVGGGLWMPEPAALKKFRLDMEDGPRAFLKIVESAEFTAHLHLLDGAKLKKVPKGFPEDHPAAELFKMKQVVAWRSFRDEEVLAPEFARQVVGAVQAMRPFLRYLEESAGLVAQQD